MAKKEKAAVAAVPKGKIDRAARHLKHMAKKAVLRINKTPAGLKRAIRRGNSSPSLTGAWFSSDMADLVIKRIRAEIAIAAEKAAAKVPKLAL